MTNKKNTKKALLSSVLSLVLCMSMLVGTTFAWFTDSVTSNYIDDMDYLIDNILFIEKGKIISQFKLSDIKNDFRYLSGKKEVLKSLISGVKVVGFEERGNELTVCIRKKLTKDDIRKYQKYMIKISEVPIQKVFIYLLNLRQKKGID